HLNATTEGQRAPVPVAHLTREALSDKTDPLPYRLTTASPGHSSFNVSLAGRTSSSQKSLPDMIIPRTPGSPELKIVEEVSPVGVKKHFKHQGRGFMHVSGQANVQTCALRRAIKETSSELGLMLKENNREKITIERVSWSELGSWLRVLMAEKTTPSTPDGLKGYMDDTHPYHEAVEITRKPQA
ncbi:hypothetical protein MAR_003853, partial [Mya arenaria]